jgi:protease-4
MIRSFFSGLWKGLTATKNAIGNLFLLAVVIVVLVVIFSDDTVNIENHTALVINPSGIVVEQKQLVDPIAGLLSGYETEETETALRDITDAIESAANDSRISALVLRLDRMQGAGLSKLEDVARSIEAFKLSGKPVLAFGAAYSQGQYYLASMADEVYINSSSYPVFSGVFLPGIGTYPLYFKSALDKLKVQFNVYKVGTFKSAVEPYQRDNMSEEAKLANLTWLDALWANYRKHITEQRQISNESFDSYTNEYDQLLAAVAGDGNQLALQQDLIDGLLSETEWRQRMSEVVGADGDDYKKTGFRSYLRIIRPPIPVVNPTSDKIAVVTASGVILNGSQPPGDIGSTNAVQMIEQARQDSSVKALVLRVDSPGGSATAAEEIRQALVNVQADGKPVVVSMSSYAASGGYWISATANKIFANTNTLTGSIGTFLTFPTLKEAAGEFGLYSDGVGTTSLSGALNPLADVPAVLDNILKQSINHSYKQFIELVAEGRDLSYEQADALAQGRVWSADYAVEHGLVDAIGSLEDAIDSAALLADVAQYDVLFVEPPLSPRERILQQLMNSSLRTLHTALGGGSWLPSSAFSGLTRFSQDIESLLRMSQQQDVYAHCLDCEVRI